MTTATTSKIDSYIQGIEIELGRQGFNTMELAYSLAVWSDEQHGMVKNRYGFYMREGIMIKTTDNQIVITRYEDHALNAGEVKIDFIIATPALIATAARELLKK